MERSGRKVWWMSKLKEFWYDLVLIVGIIVILILYLDIGDLVLMVGTDMDTILYHRSDLLL